MNNEQRKALEDLRAFITFALDSDSMSFISTLGTIGHDVRGLFDESDNIGSTGFLPRSHGYAKRCKGCGELLHGEIRVHHHTDSKTGEDITS